MRVFQRVGQKLLDHEREPFFIRQHGHARGLKREGDLFENEQFGIFACAGANDFVQGTAAEQIVGVIVAQVQIGQNHSHVLLDFEQLRRQFPAALAVFCLQQKLHSGDGRFNLMNPKGKVIRQIMVAVFIFCG